MQWIKRSESEPDPALEDILTYWGSGKGSAYELLHWDDSRNMWVGEFHIGFVFSHWIALNVPDDLSEMCPKC